MYRIAEVSSYLCQMNQFLLFTNQIEERTRIIPLRFNSGFLLPILLVLGHLETYKIEGEYQTGSNVLGLVCFSIVLGITLGKMGEKSRPLQNFFHSLSEAMMIITSWVIW